MSKNARIGFIIGALAVVVAAVVLIGSGGSDDNGSTAAEQPQTVAQTVDSDTTTTTTTTTTKPKPKPKPKPKLVVLKAGKEPKLTYKKGDTVRFRVMNPTAEEVHVHGYDLSFDLEPGKMKTVEFKADLEGVFEIELEQSAVPLAKLVVNPS